LGQYGKNFRKFLENEDVIKYFTYTETQDDYKITKPDPRCYEEILRKCNCKAEESIMAGDRIDKDIIPAKMVGMKTIRMKVGIYKDQKPRTPEEIAEITVNKLGNKERTNKGYEIKWRTGKLHIIGPHMLRHQ
jgi:FMN phosphatase YigB (HAD superfamily)